MQMSYTLYVCRKAGTVNSVANCIATVNNDLSVLALSLSPAPSSFGHGHFCGAIMNNFGHLVIIVDSAYSFPAIADSTCPLWSGWCLDLFTWPTLKNFLFVRGIWKKQTARLMTSACWSVQLQVWHHWLVFKTKYLGSVCLKVETVYMQVVRAATENLRWLVPDIRKPIIAFIAKGQTVLV